MRYSKLLWTHAFPDEPVEVYSEYDEQGRERRKVEVFPDGSLGFAGVAESSHGTALSLIPCPPDEEVNSVPEFRVVGLTREEFEDAWTKARRLVKSA